MTTSWRSWGWKLGLAGWLVVGGAIAFSGNCALAQITPDTTLGSENSTVTLTGTVDTINGGATRGANLFHSFQEFNVGEGRGAYFANPAGIENILSRVTGGNTSEILGKLGVLGNANLFLINPNGIIFGSNASLDIRGSFVASTASSLKFADGKQFSATVLETTPLLTISVPLGLQLGTNNLGTIANAGNLTVGQNLTLAAGNLNLQGQLRAGGDITLQALDTVRLRDSAENPLIAKADNHLVVQGNQAVDIFALNHPASGLFSGRDMVLRSAHTVTGDAHYTTGGDFQIERLDGKLGSLFSSYDPIIRASGDVTFESYTGASLHILAGGSVIIPGNITITGADTLTDSIIEDVTLSDGTTFVAINGNAQPTVDIRAGTTAFVTPGITGSNAGFSGETPSTNGTPTNADIAIGSITNPGGVVFLTNQYQPNSSLPSGAIQVGAVDTSVVSGNAGAVTIDSRDSLTTGKVESTSFANGNGGAVTLKAQNDITTTDDILTLALKPEGDITNAGEVGNSGNISLSSTAGAIDTTRSSLDAGTTSSNGGTISLNAYKDITTAGLNSYVVGNGRGNGGNISLTSTAGAIETTAGFLYSFSSNGSGGNITLNAADSITTGKVESTSFANGNGGAVTLKAQNDITTTDDILTLALKPEGDIINAGDIGNSGNISLSSTAGAIDTTRSSLDVGTTSSNGGTITLNAYNDITTGDLRSYVVGDGRGNGGDISLTSTAGAIKTTAGFLYSFSSNGSGGNITLNAAGNITAGDILSDSSASGSGGNINFTSNAEVYLANSRISTVTRGSGKGGDINIKTGSLFASKGAELITSTYGEGNAGNVTINTRDHASFDGDQKVITLESQGSAPGSHFRFLRRTQEGKVDLARNPSTGTRWRVNEISDGIITLKTQGFEPDPRFLDALTARGEVGLAPNTNPPFTGTRWRANEISDGIITLESQVSVPGSRFLDGRTVEGTVGLAPSTDDPFTGTKWRVNESGFISTKVYSRVEEKAGAEARGGNIHIMTGSLSVTNGAFLSAATDGIGNAGNVSINARDHISLDGTGRDGFPSGLYSGVLRDAKGQGGSLRINTGQLVVRNGAQVSANSQGLGNAGSLRVEAGSIKLDNRGKLRATTASGEGGNINLQVRDLILMRRNSLISAEARGTGNGGNITINAPFIIAVPQENSDIIANAFQGNGGNINIKAQSIFGLEYRDHPTSTTSDINASSDFGVEGVVEIDTPDIDPSQGLSELPVQPIDTEVVQACTPGSSQQSEFVVTGRGGLPQNPGEALSTDAVQVDLVTLNPEVKRPSTTAVSTSSTSPTPIPIVEAQGWAIAANGEVILTANAPTVTPDSSWQKTANCQQLN